MSKLGKDLYYYARISTTQFTSPTDIDQIVSTDANIPTS